MKKRTLITLCMSAWLCVSCISLYSMGTENSYYSDGIYYVPQKTTESTVVVTPEQTYTLDAPVVVNNYPSPSVIEGYWLGGWDGSNADLQRAYRIIENYPNGFGYMVRDEIEIAENMAFSSDWNVFVSDGRFWWFPTSMNIALYTDFLFGPYPSVDMVLFDYTPYRLRAGVTIGYYWNSPWYYDPWFYDPWYYDSWYHHYYDAPWYHHHGHHYGPHHPNYEPHHPGYRPNYGPGPNNRPHRPENIRPQKPGGTPGKPGNGSKPDQPHRPNQGKWRPVTTPGGGQTITPGTTQRPAVGGGVVGGNGAPKQINNGNVVRPGNNNGSPATRGEGQVTPPKNRQGQITRPNGTRNNTTVTRPSNRPNSTTVTRPNGNRNTTVTRPSNNSSSRVTRPANSSSQRVTRPTNSGSYRSSGVSRPTGGGTTRSTGGGGGRISRTR